MPTACGRNVVSGFPFARRLSPLRLRPTISLLFNNAGLFFQSSLNYNFAAGDITGQDLILQGASTITANSVTLVQGLVPEFFFLSLVPGGGGSGQSPPLGGGGGADLPKVGFPLFSAPKIFWTQQ